MKKEEIAKQEDQNKESSSACHPTTVYSTSYEHRYHITQNNARKDDECPKLSGPLEAAAMNAAWKHFNQLAKSYCNEGSCAGDKTCTETITNRSAKKGVQRRKFTPTPNDETLGTLECFITIEMTASISCACS